MKTAISQTVIPFIKPTPDEQKRVSAATKKFITKLNAVLKDAHAVLGGSGAKGTWLSGNHDLDIFVLYPRRTYAPQTSQLSELLEKSLTKAFPKQKLQRVHGSRDYFQLVFEGFNLEVVPILRIQKAEQAVNITDVSPLHTRWVRKQPAEIKDEILLAKQFCRAHDFYGAESYIGGFSGYVLEILVSYYGSFEKLLWAALKWKKNEVIDIEKKYPQKNALFHLNQSKIRSPLIVIDPVDKNRNAAAALTEEKWSRFQKKAQEYLKKPAAAFFEKKQITTEIWKTEVSARGHHGAWMDFTLHAGKEDVLGMKIVKVLDVIQKELAPFTVLSSNWIWDKSSKASLYVEVKTDRRPAEEIRIGPPLHLTEFVADFQKKNKKTYVKHDRVVATIRVAQTSLEENLKTILQKPYILEKIKSPRRTTLR